MPPPPRLRTQTPPGRPETPAWPPSNTGRRLGTAANEAPAVTDAVDDPTTKRHFSVALSDAVVALAFTNAALVYHVVGDGAAAAGFGLIAFAAFLGMLRWGLCPCLKRLNEEVAYLAGFVGLPLAGLDAVQRLTHSMALLDKTSNQFVVGTSGGDVAQYVAFIVCIRAVATALFWPRCRGAYEQCMGAVGVVTFALPRLLAGGVNGPTQRCRDGVGLFLLAGAVTSGGYDTLLRRLGPLKRVDWMHFLIAGAAWCFVQDVVEVKHLQWEQLAYRGFSSLYYRPWRFAVWNFALPSAAEGIAKGLWGR